MDTLPYFPQWPLEANNFVLFGLLLIAGVVGGYLAHRTKYLPTITGFIIIGLLLGPSVTGILTPDLLSKSSVFVDIALALILFELGALLDIRQFLTDKSLFFTSLAESMASFILVFSALAYFDIQPLHAALAAAIAISASPAVLLVVIREFGASGPVTERSTALVALNNLWSFLTFIMFLPFLHLLHQKSLAIVIFQPIYHLIGSVVTAYLIWQLLLRLAVFVGNNPRWHFSLIIASIILTVGAAHMLNVSSLLTLLMLGIFKKNLDKNNVLSEIKFEQSAQIFYIILFVFAGANLHLHELKTAGMLALVFVLARVLGKWVFTLALSRAYGMSWTHAHALGLTLVPMAGLAIGLTQTTAAMYSDFGSTLAAIVFGAIAILETIGPIATEYALKLAGEVRTNEYVKH